MSDCNDFDDHDFQWIVVIVVMSGTIIILNDSGWSLGRMTNEPVFLETWNGFEVVHQE